jgi:hypothetical protein
LSYFDNPQHFSHLRNSPRNSAFGAPEEVDGAAALGNKKARLAGRAFALSTLGQANMALLSKGTVPTSNGFISPRCCGNDQDSNCGDPMARHSGRNPSPGSGVCIVDRISGGLSEFRDFDGRLGTTVCSVCWREETRSVRRNGLLDCTAAGVTPAFMNREFPFDLLSDFRSFALLESAEYEPARLIVVKYHDKRANVDGFRGR